MKKLIYLPLFLLMIFAIAACSGKEEATKTTNNTIEENGAPKDGGTLTLGVTDNPQVMNPLYANDRVTLTIQQSLYAPLYNLDNGKKEYVLAESFEPSEDQLSWTLKLKDNLKWHDGEKITADDIVFTIESILDVNQNSSLHGNLIFKGEPLKVEKIDELTVLFTLPQVSAAFEGVMNDFFPIPKHVFENESDIMKSELNLKPIGSGPFKFKEFKTDEYIILERFDDYFAGKAKLDSVVYRIVKDPNTANISLQKGEINARLIDPQDYSKLNATDQFNMVTFPEGRLYYMAFNLNSKPVQKKEIREAIAHALDKDELIQTAFISSEFADVAASVLTPDTQYQSSDVTTYDYDQEKAKELVASAGDTGKIRVIYSNSNKIQESLALYTQQKLQEVGLTVELIPMDASAYGQKTIDMATTDYEISFGGYIMGAEPDVYRSLFQSDAAYNFARYKNAAFDQLWEDAAVEIDAEKRGDLYHQIQQTIAEDIPYLPLAYPKAIIAIDKKFGGIEEANPIPVSMFADLSKIYEVE